ncbi:MAG: hypothetical protein EOM41_06805 [Bacilli bacterium]|nr:hypothetical protein [Bacilli bacterium]
MKIQFKKERGQLIPYSDEDERKLKKMQDGACYVVEIKNLDMRTLQQNKALHKYFSLVAEALNDRQLTVKTIIKADIEWNPLSVKEMLWKPIQEAVLHKKSTTELKRKEIDDVYDTINRALGEKFGIYVPFPTIER